MDIKAKTQLYEAVFYLNHISNEANRKWLSAFDSVVGRAQNRPPLGEADGSIDEKTWYIFQDLVRAAETFVANLERAQNHVYADEDVT